MINKIFLLSFCVYIKLNLVTGQYGIYQGIECQGVFTNIQYTLYDPITSSYVIDNQVNETINYLYTESIWLTQSCVSSFRQHSCMLLLSNVTTTQYQLQLIPAPVIYCQSDCLDLGSVLFFEPLKKI